MENRLSNAVRILRIFNYILRTNQRIRDFLNYNRRHVTKYFKYFRNRLFRRYYNLFLKNLGRIQKVC